MMSEPIYLPDLTIQRPIDSHQLPPLLVTINQACAILNMSYDTVYGMCKRGDLEIWQRGRLLRIKYSSLVDLVENGQKRSG
jgi:excisionase family DNA binding protein